MSKWPRAGAAGTAISDLVVVSLGPVPPLPRSQRALHLSLAAAAPAAYELAPRRGAGPESGPDAWTEWAPSTVVGWSTPNSPQIWQCD